MKAVKNIFIVLAYVSIVACAAVGLQVTSDAKTVLQQSVISSIGYLIGTNNPDHYDKILMWYKAFQATQSLEEAQKEFQAGINELIVMTSDDSYLQFQLKNAMSAFNISLKGPPSSLDIDRYRFVVDNFMSGVAAARITS